MKKTNLVVIVAIISALTARADNFASVSASGNIISTGGNVVAQSGNITAGGLIACAGDSIRANGGYLYAQQYITTPGYVTATGYLSTSGYVQGTTYVLAPEGRFSSYIRVGGTTNTPAASAVQIGPNAKASAYGSLVVGQYNKVEGTPGSWQVGTATAAEPLLVAGNGTSTTPKNAFAVYKDGTVTMGQAQGDIAMGQFGN